MVWVERRLPQDDELFLDHVGWFVPDLDAARAAMERLGFAVSPQNVHYNADAGGNLVPAGTVNRLVTPALGYLEFLAASGGTPLADQLRAALARHAGLHLIAFGHADLHGMERRLAAAGVPLQPTVRLRRPLDTPEGRRTAAFTVLRAAPGSMPEGRVQYCAHETPELVWQPGLTEHANAVDALSDMLLVCADLGETVRRYERFTRRAAQDEGDGRAALRLDRGRLTFATVAAAERLLPDFAAPSLPFGAAVALRSRDLEATRAVLQRNRIRPARDMGDIVIVGPEDGLGAWIVFHGPAISPVWRHVAK